MSRVRRRWLKRAAAALLLAVTLSGALVGGLGYTPPDPELCDALQTQSESTSDVAIAMEERGCEDKPSESPSPTVLGRAGDRDGNHG